MPRHRQREGGRGPAVGRAELQGHRGPANQTAGRLETFVMVPHKPMPAIALELSEVRNVVAYILSLK